MDGKGVGKIEDAILKFWESNRIYEELKKKSKDRKKFFFLDGPPYATGSIHLGTALNKILKDCFIRFFRMQGFDVWDQPGYDTHGLPIEYKVEQKLKFKSKKDIEKFGVAKFVQECRNYATQFIGLMNEQFKNLGVWMDWSNPYLTLSNEYIEGAWATFKEGFKKGLLFRGKYPVHVCPRCETSLAYNEIEYKRISEEAIYVRLKIAKEPKTFLLIYTTTPWTLPANTGVMANPTAEYVRVKVKDEELILAKVLVERVLAKAGIKNYEIVETLKGKELEGLRYEHPLLDLFPFQKELSNAHRVVLSERYVTLEEGTGLVHSAPGHGKEDYEVGKANGLPVVCHVRMDGKFDEACGKFAGMYVKDADKLIVEELRKRGLLFHVEAIVHEYPHCWRCKSPLLLLAVEQWFFRVTGMREKLLEESEKVEWVPDWAGKRFRNWLESLGDWPISRQRYWGIPLPIWVCENCKEVKVIGSRDELPFELADFHKPAIDEVRLRCENCNGPMKRIPEVLDVWFDSGVASWASLGYPKRKDLVEKLWPAELVMEGPDQIRGWWNSQLITGVMTFGSTPFKRVLFHGFILDSQGRKMSKSLGNVVEPSEIIKQYGRDVLRLYFLSQPVWKDYFFKWEDVREVSRKLMVVRNVFNFVETYLAGFSKPEKLELEDKWILSRLNSLIKNLKEGMRSLNISKCVNWLLEFALEDFSRWYIKLIRDRVWVFYEGKDKETALYTLLEVSRCLVRLLAPFAPFLAEQAYQQVLKPYESEESVHLTLWPEPKQELIDEKLEKQMEVVRAIFEGCACARNKAKLKLRRPVRKVIVVSKKAEVKEAVKRLSKILTRVCNAKEVEVSSKPVEGLVSATFDYGSVQIDASMNEQLKAEALLRELIRNVQELRKREGLKVTQRIKLGLFCDPRSVSIIRKYEERIKREVGAYQLLLDLVGEARGKVEFEGMCVEISFK